MPIVFATYPLIAGIDKAGIIFNLVFFISVSSVLVQGTTLAWLARLLGLTKPEESRDETVKDEVKIMELVIEASSPVIRRKIVDLSFPDTAHIMTIKRDDQYIQPNGSTTLLEGDRLFILAENPIIAQGIRKFISGR